MKALLTVAAASGLLYLSPGVRSWLGSRLIVLGFELVEAGPAPMSEEQKQRGAERLMREIERERQWMRRNGDERP